MHGPLNVKFREHILVWGASQQHLLCQIRKPANFTAPADNVISFRPADQVTPSAPQLIQTKPLHLVFLISTSPSEAQR